MDSERPFKASGNLPQSCLQEQGLAEAKVKPEAKDMERPNTQNKARHEKQEQRTNKKIIWNPDKLQSFGRLQEACL